MMTHPPIPVTDLEDHINLLRANEGARFSQEYESIEPGQQFTWEMSNREANKAKNRYANVIAYDHSRVVLQTLDGLSESSYINANYMDGYRKHNAYIATQVYGVCNTTKQSCKSINQSTNHDLLEWPQGQLSSSFMMHTEQFQDGSRPMCSKRYPLATVHRSFLLLRC